MFGRLRAVPPSQHGRDTGPVVVEARAVDDAVEMGTNITTLLTDPVLVCNDVARFRISVLASTFRVTRPGLDPSPRLLWKLRRPGS